MTNTSAEALLMFKAKATLINFFYKQVTDQVGCVCYPNPKCDKKKCDWCNK